LKSKLTGSCVTIVQSRTRNKLRAHAFKRNNLEDTQDANRSISRLAADDAVREFGAG
jgi:hypothetical protein